MLTYLVKGSAMLFTMSTFFSNTFWFSTASLKKWYYTSIWFFFEWYAGLFSNNISFWMPQSNLTTCLNPNYEHNLYNQTTYLLAWVAFVYSILVVDNEMIGCFILIQLTSLLDNIKTNPLVNFLLSISLAHSVSKKPYTNIFLLISGFPW